MTMRNHLLIIILFSMFSLGYLTPMQTWAQNITYVKLSPINIDHTKFLKNIMDEIISEDTDSKHKLYFMGITPETDKTRIRVHLETRDLSTSDDFRGFFTIGKDTIVVACPSSYPIVIDNDCKKSSFLTRNYPPGIYDPITWTYYVSDYYYARLIHQLGWVFHLSQDNIESLNTKWILVEPKRKFKSSSNKH